MSMLNNPYPIPDKSKYAIISSLILGLTAYLFVIVFQPFGTDLWNHPHKYLLLSVYGLITSLVLITEFFAFSGRLKDEKNWTVKKELIKYAIIFIVCSLLSYAYNMILFPRPFVLIDFLYMFFIVFSISILIFSNYILINYFILSRKYSEKTTLNNPNFLPEKNALENNEKQIETQLLRFLSENQKDEFSIPLNDFLFAETADNYLKIHFINDRGSTSKMIRNTLSKTIKNIEGEFIKRCHRSYIINLQKVNEIKGNAQGYRLYFEDFEDFIPVSRSYISTVIPSLKHLN